MSTVEIKSVLHDVLSKRLGAEHVRAHEDSWASDLWSELVELGMTSIDVPEERGDPVEDSIAAALAVIESCGFHNANLPIVSAGFVGSWVLAHTGLPKSAGMDGVAICDGKSLRVSTENGTTTLSGEVEVPWGRFADRILILYDTGLDVRLFVVDPDQAQATATWRLGSNLAGEPRDRIRLENAIAAAVHELPIPPMELQARLGLGLATLMVGALDRVVELAIEQVRVREQFGRPLSRFQVIQHYIASMVAELAAVRAAIDGAIPRSNAAGDIDVRAAAAAKVRAGVAMQTIVPLAHQVHGAMGVTDEHDLGLSTRRLWSWRDEGGDEQFWSRVLGREVASAAYLTSLWAVLEPTE